MVAKPGKPFRVIARLLYDAAGDQDSDGTTQDELSHNLFNIHNNNLGQRPLVAMLSKRNKKWLPSTLKKAREAWNHHNPDQPFPDLNDPKNIELVEELAQATQAVDRSKVKARMEGRPKEY